MWVVIDSAPARASRSPGELALAPGPVGLQGLRLVWTIEEGLDTLWFDAVSYNLSLHAGGHMTQPLIRTDVAYKIGPSKWEEPRCYWRADAIGVTICLNPSVSGPAHAWKFESVRSDHYYIFCNEHPVGLAGGKLVLKAKRDEAALFKISQVGPYYVFSRVQDHKSCLVECEDGNLGLSTDIQLWEGTPPVTAWTDVDAIPDGWFRNLWKLDPLDVKPATWMSSLPDDRRLHELSIAGTHDTCTWAINWKAAAAAGAATGAAGGVFFLGPLGVILGTVGGALTGGFIAETSTTQWLDLGQQLAAGVRYLDIRLHDDLMIYHAAIPTGVSLDDVLKAISRFLKQPGSERETIVMQIKREGPKVGGSLSDTAYRDKVNAVMNDTSRQITWYTKNEIPQLRDVRGKIVLVRRYWDRGQSPRGIDLSNWPGRKVIGAVTVKIQDNYELGDTSAKEAEIQGMLTDMATREDRQWYINFTSSSGGRRPLVHAVVINPWLGERLNFQTWMHGVFMMDYPSPELVDRIVRLNDFSPAPPAPPGPPPLRTPAPVGSGSAPFDDWPGAQAFGPITALAVRAGNIIDSVQAVHGAHQMPNHGGSGGDPDLITLDPGDVLVEISGFHGNWFGASTILQLTLKTRRGKVYGPLADMAFATDRTAFSFKAEANEQIIALSGATRSAPEADGKMTQFLSQLGVTIKRG